MNPWALAWLELVAHAPKPAPALSVSVPNTRRKFLESAKDAGKYGCGNVSSIMMQACEARGDTASFGTRSFPAVSRTIRVVGGRVAA